MTDQLTAVDRLYVDSVHVTSVNRDWSEGHDETWDFIEAPECPECGTYARWTSGADLADQLADVDAIESASFSNDVWEAWRCPNPECDSFGEETEAESEGPMMSCSYALPDKSWGSTGGYDQSDAEKIVHLPLCIVTFEDTGDQALALTSGGMDLSWEISEAFMRLGHLPPLAYCDLPAMAGMKMDERRRWVLAGCLRSCDVAAAQAQRTADRLRQNFDR